MVTHTDNAPPHCTPRVLASPPEHPIANPRGCKQVSNILAVSGIVRSDITTSFGTSTTTAAGVPLQLTITLVNSNMACAPLEGYAIYIWHCNRDGNYSLYSSGVQNENYLRGVQVTD